MPSERAGRWLIAAQVLLLGLLIVGAVWPHGPFEGKGMAYRLPVFAAPGWIVWWRWRHRRADHPPYPVALGTALTVPFLLDTLGNALGLFDNVSHFDDALHFVNWAVLCAGVTLTFARGRIGAGATSGYHLLAGSGFGAIAIIGWEALEYAIMRSGVGGLDLTYADTVADLLLSTAGGVVGAAWAARHR
ncbi:MAG TPA: hypothetical protein DCR14_13570 [Acidimicrobiaceae bacterium]|nr:hypothetical protein [Acidimicrobiaceae bacterium]